MSTKKRMAAVALTVAALSLGSIGVASADHKGAVKTSVLAELVKAGTITQAQADAIVSAQAAVKAAHEANKGAREAGKSIVKRDKGELLTLISTTVGLDTTTVVTRIKAGESLAAIAGAKKDALVAALVANQNARIDAAVTAGTVTAAQATILKSNVAAHVAKMVDATPAPLFRGGHGEKGERGHGGKKGGPMGGAPVIPAPATTPAGATA